MLLGFYDRNNNGLAVELSPEMAKAIASIVKDSDRQHDHYL